MSHRSKKSMELFELFIALGAWAVAIFVGYIAFKVGIRVVYTEVMFPGTNP